MRLKAIVLASILIVALAPLGVPSASASGDLKSSIVSMYCVYGVESWKADAASNIIGNILGPIPPDVPGAANDTLAAKDYRMCLGCWLNMTVLITKSDGTPIDAARSYSVSAYMQNPSGNIIAAVKDHDGKKFTLTFDLDGERNTDNPIASMGTHMITVNITEETGMDPYIPNRLRGTDVFTVAVGGSSLGTSVMPIMLPETAIREYQDVSSGLPYIGEFMPVLSSPVGLDDNIVISFNAGVANKTATISRFIIKPIAPGAPSIPGTTSIDSKVLSTGMTGSDGRMSLIVKGKDLIGNATGGIAILAGYVSSDLFLEKAPAAAYAFAVPVSDHKCKIEDYKPNYEIPYFYSGTTDVIVEDFDGGSVGTAYATSPGDLFVISNLGKVWTYQFDPAPPTYHYRVAHIQNSDTGNASITAYTTAAMLYSGQDFYGIAYGSRGYMMSASGGSCILGKSGTITISVTSLTTNYDGDVDPGCAMKIKLTATNIPGLGNWSKDVEIPELGQVTETISFKPDETGIFNVLVRSETPGLSCNRSVNVRVMKAEDAKKGFLGLPGFEFVIAVGAALAVLAARKRRR